MPTFILHDGSELFDESMEFLVYEGMEFLVD